MNIFEKISEVMKRVEYLTKDDSVEFGNTKYKAISEEKVTRTIRKELINLGIVILPIKQEKNITELIRTEKSVNQRADVHTRYRIQNIEDVNDYIEVESDGSGVDTQDKAIGKAMTYAYKYMLLRTFAIPTGEDPDKISSAEIDDKIGKEVDEEVKAINKNQLSVLQSLIKDLDNAKSFYDKILIDYAITDLSQLTNKQYGLIVKEIQNMIGE